MRTRNLAILFMVLVFAAGTLPAQMKQQPAAKPVGKPGLLTADEVKAALPESVFFRGEKAPIQLRNAGGARFAEGKLVLITLVDNSGYSSAIAEKYQAYFITEVKLKLGDRDLAPGAYGCGVVNGKFIVMDLAANELFSVAAPVDD